MLIIKGTELLDNHKLSYKKIKTNKTQIFLFDTQRRVDDYILKLKYRNNGKYQDIPHFIITKLGDVIEIFDTKYASKTFNNSKIDNKLIKIAIENLGWLSKNTITGFLNNWIGDPYRAEPHIKGWRDHYFWDRYSESQIKTIKILSHNLCEQHKIPFKSVLSSGYLHNAHNFCGIVSKSNYSNIYTDINPSFDFKIFIENEENVK